VRNLIEGIVEELLKRHRAPSRAGHLQTAQRPERVDLNDIAEVIGSRAVTYEEVEYIIMRLEAEGLNVGEPLSTNDIAIMRHIIVTAHRLNARLRRRPTVDEIAIDSGHPPHTVRRALEHGRSAARSRA
jgi:hypothetical protein